MQTTGYLAVDKQITLILVRQKKYGRALKIRKSGGLGTYFEDESIFLQDNPSLFKQLKDGNVISI